MYIIYILPTENLCWNDQCHCFVLSLFFSPSNLVISPRINPNYINVKLCRLSLGHACCLGVNFFPSLSPFLFILLSFSTAILCSQMQRNAYSHVLSPLCTKRYSKCDILRTLFTINNYTLSYVQRHWKPAILFQLLSFFPSLFAHPFLSILSFSFSSQLVDKSLSCTRIYLNNTSV